MLEFISTMRNREEGQALVEYALILSLVSVVAIGAPDPGRHQRHRHPEPDRGRPVGIRVCLSPRRSASGGDEAERIDMIANLISSSRRDDGQALVEYALVLSLVSLVTVGALTLLGTNVTTALNTIGTAL